MPEERKIRVTCGAVSLQLTLGAKLLAKPFDEAVIKPFLTAYAKRTGEPAELSRVARVEVDEEMLGDTSIGASVVLLKNETVDAEIFLRPIEVQESLRANEISADPFAPLPEILPSTSGGATASGRTLAAPPPRDMSKDTVDFDEDNLTPIERLKRERRAARERGEAASSIEILKQAAAATVVLQEVDATSAGTSAAAQAAVSAKPTSSQAAVPAMPQPPQAPPPPPPPPPLPPLAVAASAANAATDALDEAESAVARLSAELAALTDACEDGAATGEAQREEASKRAAALLSQVGRVIQALDDVAMGHLADSDREDARARKKRAVATLEGTLLPAVQRVQQQLLPTRDAGGRAAALSAEIDSDED